MCFSPKQRDIIFSFFFFLCVYDTMESGCSFPLCDSLPVVRKCQARMASNKEAGVQNGQAVVHLISSVRVQPSMLYVKAETTANGAPVAAPAWMRDHLLLLYNGVFSEVEKNSRRRAHAEPRSHALTDGAERAKCSDEVVGVFHSFFGLAERQRRERVKQQLYPF